MLSFDLLYNVLPTGSRMREYMRWTGDSCPSSGCVNIQVALPEPNEQLLERRPDMYRRLVTFDLLYNRCSFNRAYTRTYALGRRQKS